MDYRIENNDSSDEDFSENLQAGRFLFVRSESKIGNCHKKKILLDDQSSSSSLEARNDPSKASTSGSIVPYNKKRQNGDKNAEPFANPKRTCLNSRSRKPHDFHHKKHYNGIQISNLPQNATLNSAKRNLFPDKTYEDDNNSEKSDPSSSKHRSLKRIHNKQSKELDDINYVPPSDFRPYQCQTDRGYILNRDKSESSESEHTKRFPWNELQNEVGVSEFIPPSDPPRLYPYRFSPINSANVVHYVDSASDEDSRTVVTKGSLKGGRQSPELSQRTKKVVGRKVKKILDSDDTDDDYPINNQRKPVFTFSSSDSDESEMGIKELKKTTGASENATNHSLPLNNDTTSKNQFKCHPPGESFRSACFSNDGCFAGATCSTPPPIYNAKASRHCRNRKNNRGNAATSDVASVGFNPVRNNSLNVRNRSRIGANERYIRRSGSPHPSSLPNSHPRMTRAEASKSTKGRSLTGSYNRRTNLNLATTYPDLFDAEDSSEVEFFTANSYSDTETSAESFGGLRISATVMTGESEDQAIHIGSSDDEISVVFSTGPSNRNGDQRRGTSRAIGRRHNRGSGRHLTNSPVIVSLSPDPVEQVRQVEDDERFARMLQAQFDAEVDPNYVPAAPDSTLPHLELQPPLFETDIEIEDNNESGRRWESSPPPLLPSVFSPSHRRGIRRSRIPNRFLTPNFFENLFYNSRRLDRNRRRLNNHDTRSHIARLFETSLFGGPFTEFLSSEDSFETNIGIAELNGDVPRGLQRGEINRLPTRKFFTAGFTDPTNNLAQVPHKRAELNKECQVCLSDYENGDTLRILPCFHEFHTPCIDPWLKINHTCPVCRVVVDLG